MKIIKEVDISGLYSEGYKQVLVSDWVNSLYYVFSDLSKLVK